MRDAVLREFRRSLEREPAARAGEPISLLSRPSGYIC